ncbi:MAG TPA: Uma2 family endonuclease [Saprospiraceae bacterium]|nr:Uma2 family endonuclease [Saprospiraceae bacterium]
MSASSEAASAWHYHRLQKLQAKMTATWMADGVRLGWLIGPYEERVHICRDGQPAEVLQGFSGRSLSGEDVLPGFELPLEYMKR